ncbi:ninjurin-1-like [Uloborus diversus]|uniref:ninjurin-1-like n=1 Tax=Uloborus diversus TaxID=327109 RepID=UPI0024095824|nr:ninjurin-1-like [Uloborus diversus]
MKCRQGDQICAALNYIKNLKFCTYCRRKSYSQISMDIALIVVNAAHMTQIIRMGNHDSLYFVKLILVGLSIFLEISIGVLLVVKERFDIEDERQHRIMDVLNDLTVWLIFMSTFVHVFVSVFTDNHHLSGQFKTQQSLYHNCSSCCV